MPNNLQNKVSLVTGAASGIGRATALSFAKEGSKVVVSDVSSEGGEETASLIKDMGGESLFVHADVSRSDHVENLISTAITNYGRLDCSFNNAGVSGGSGLIHEYSEDDWDKVININLKGVWLCLKFEIIQMLKQGGGSIFWIINKCHTASHTSCKIISNLAQYNNGSSSHILTTV